MSDLNICYLTASEALRRFKDRTLSPVELLQAYLARAEETKDTVNGFTALYAEEALADARKAEARYAVGAADLRPLEGLPTGIKDENNIEGKVTTFGSLIYKDNVATSTTPVVQRLLDAGVVVHGRTTTPEFSSEGFTHSRLWGVTRNPWNLDYTPGGSSGGSGAVLAAGMAADMPAAVVSQACTPQQRHALCRLDTLAATVRDADLALTAALDAARVENGAAQEGLQESDDALAHEISLLRMCKDDYEIEQMRAAVAATHHGFDAMVAELTTAAGSGRGERWLEGTFAPHARHRGNGVGYDSICAAGDHANTLHWIKNTGEVREGDLVLIDAGVEVDSLFTADVTRTFPVSGTFTDAQREIYDAVYAAQEAGIAAVKPGNKFSDVHAAAIRVIAEHLHAWGLLPDGVSVEDTLDKEHGQYHRRWMVHGTSHHLGLDVHDCALATREEYMDAVLRPGMVLTVEPGLYFKSDDLLAPERFRGTGVRIEDDVVVTADGCENLSAGMPRSSADVEAWIGRLRPTTP